MKKSAPNTALCIRFILYSIFFFPLATFVLVFSLVSLRKEEMPFTHELHQQTVAHAVESSLPEAVPTPILQKEDKIDTRILTLQHFFAEKNSPLAEYAQSLVQAADTYDLDYRLIPAISMQESNGCKRIPKDSHNCWGLGIYGNKVMTFDSYENAILAVAQTLKEKYKDEGLTNATLVEDKWNPNSNGEWSYGVNFYLGQIRAKETSLR